MVTTAGTVKVMDFGCSRSPEDLDSTRPQDVLATPRYLCPEQAEGRSTDARADLYSTGCLLYELLTGRPPFVADSAVALAYQHVHEPPTPPSAHRLVGPDLDRVVQRALVKAPAGRYQRAEQFHADLLAIRARLLVEQSDPLRRPLRQRPDRQCLGVADEGPRLQSGR
jgi:serine/threonine-protein kinase